MYAKGQARADVAQGQYYWYMLDDGRWYHMKAVKYYEEDNTIQFRQPAMGGRTKENFIYIHRKNIRACACDAHPSPYMDEKDMANTEKKEGKWARKSL